MDKDEVCYWCGKLATSREHVPPKCLFPEEKDVKEIYAQSFRNNLITVPSCDEHNMAKSHEDEYLMACLSGRVGNNAIAYVHNATKVKRSRYRNPNMIKIDGEDILKIDGKEFPVQCVTVDTNKLMHSFEAIARALYFYERNKNFKGDCKIVSRIFTHPGYKKWSDFHVRAAKMIEKEQAHWGTEIRGANTDIFTYQFSPVDGFKCQTLALTFYKSTKVYVILSSMTKEETEKVKLKFTFITKAIFGNLE
ncbi:hypothetical protein [Clostridium lundense]|uniref:hypothetical protein n=1 Tax=Clostridium lundense TaxID=319475 RepID=UPI0006864031|nr:hypothetical protein [Clostridium lundense]